MLRLTSPLTSPLTRPLAGSEHTASLADTH